MNPCVKIHYTENQKVNFTMIISNIQLKFFEWVTYKGLETLMSYKIAPVFSKVTLEVKKTVYQCHALKILGESYFGPKIIYQAIISV